MLDRGACALSSIYYCYQQACCRSYGGWPVCQDRLASNPQSRITLHHQPPLSCIHITSAAVRHPLRPLHHPSRCATCLDDLTAMPSETAPSTPESAPSVAHPPAIRRSLTVPAKLRPPARPSSSDDQAGAEAVETLFATSFARVVTFSAATPRPGSSRGAADKEAVLPWVLPTERTLAAG